MYPHDIALHPYPLSWTIFSCSTYSISSPTRTTKYVRPSSAQSVVAHPQHSYHVGLHGWWLWRGLTACWPTLPVHSIQVPFSFRLSLPAPSAPSVSPASRHLLDIEKLTLATNAEGRVLREEVPADHIDGQAVVQLDVSWSGRAPSAEAEAALRSAGVEYIIVCDTLLAPGLPRFVPALLAVLAVALLVGIRYVVPLIIRHARAVEVEAQSESGKQR